MPALFRCVALSALPLIMTSCGGGGANPTPKAPTLATDARCLAGMALIPGGTFMQERMKTEKTVAETCLDGTEVTVAAYGTCVTAGKCTEPKPGKDECNWKNADRAQHPINCVDWSQATAYCAWAEKRLPTMDEWEWAARGGNSSSKYPWGNGAPEDRACWDGEDNDLGMYNRKGTCPVGSFSNGANPQGVVDLGGNVSEWTETGIEMKQARGGGWRARVDELEASEPGLAQPTNANVDQGFRCAKSVQ